MSKVNIVMSFTKVATVKLLNEGTTKVYDFRLYDEDAKVDDLVIVNPRSESNRVLGKIVEITDADKYPGGTPTAEVVAVVDESKYNQRCEELVKLHEDIVKRDKLEKEIKTRINKLQEIEMYEAIAQKYKDVDPELMNMVTELKSLDEKYK